MDDKITANDHYTVIATNGFSKVLRLTERYTQIKQNIPVQAKKILDMIRDNGGRVCTHDGIFHAEDIFCTALLSIVSEDLLGIKVRVIRNPRYASDQILTFDTGSGRFDHHQPDAKVRANGVKYAAFGLLWEVLGCLFFDEEWADIFDREFIQPLDISDNTGTPSAISDIISSFNPVWDFMPLQGCQECESEFKNFEKAVATAKDILIRKIMEYDARRRAAEMINEAKKSSLMGIVTLPCSIPYKDALNGEKYFFIVYKSHREGEWNAQVIPYTKAGEPPKSMYYFPKSWAGLRGEALQNESRMEGLLFCHAGRFLIAATSQESAWSACLAAIHSNSTS